MFNWLRNLFRDPDDRHIVRCPVCLNYTLKRRNPLIAAYNICPVCYWEDDDWFGGGGANDPDLITARQNYLNFGAIEKRFIQHVRKPRDYEKSPR